MPPVYNFPTAYEIEQVEKVLIERRESNSILGRIMPFDSSDSDILIWEQMDNFIGYQQWRGLNNKPLTVPRVGRKRYMAEPGYYGEKMAIREDELTRRRRNAALTGAAGPIDVSDLVAECHAQLLDRRLTLIDKIRADLLFTGAFTVPNWDGSTVYQGSYTQQQITPTVPWSTVATATPLADMRNYRLLEYGQSVTFANGNDNFQLMSVETLNTLLRNTNANDLGGRKIVSGNSLNSASDLNRIFLDNDIPPIVVMSDGYFSAAGTFTRFLPAGKVLVVGHRTSGVKVGNYRYTRNVNSPNAAPVPYVRVETDDRVPLNIEVHDGHNGGPVIQYPGSLILVNAY